MFCPADEARETSLISETKMFYANRASSALAWLLTPLSARIFK